MSILYKTQLPLLLVFNKVDVMAHGFAVEWMKDYDAFRAALKSDSTYAAELSASLCLARPSQLYTREQQYHPVMSCSSRLTLPARPSSLLRSAWRARLLVLLVE